MGASWVRRWSLMLAVGLALVAEASGASAQSRCEPVATEAKLRLGEAITARFEGGGGPPLITFPDCVSTDLPRRILLERGTGHGGWLRLDNLVWEDSFLRWTVIDWDPQGPVGSRTSCHTDSAGVTICVGEPAPTVAQVYREGALAPSVLRDALTVLQTEVTPAPYPEGTMGTWGSSADVHVRVRAELADGTVVERVFTGYRGSEGEPQLVVAELAWDLLAVPLEGLTSVPPLPDTTDFFSERFVAVFDAGETSDWWVEDALVYCAARLGNREVAQRLVERALQDSELVDPADAQRVGRALAALAELSGIDYRLDESGGQRPVLDVIRDYQIWVDSAASP